MMGYCTGIQRHCGRRRRDLRDWQCHLSKVLVTELLGLHVMPGGWSRAARSSSPPPAASAARSAAPGPSR